MFVFKLCFSTIRGSLAGGCVLVALSATAATTRDDTEIQRWINQHAQRTNSVELPATRYRVVGDLDGDGRNDIALLYTLKPRAGRHGESRYLVAFKRQREESHGGRRDGLRYHAHVLVSGPGAGEANRATILERAVVVEMLTFRPGDAACCPTRPTTRRYRLAPHALTLIRPDTAKRAR